MPLIAARASSAPMIVPIAAGNSTIKQVAKSQKPKSVAVGDLKNKGTATKVENANGQMRRGSLRLATAAPIRVRNATKALQGRIRMPEMSTL